MKSLTAGDWSQLQAPCLPCREGVWWGAECSNPLITWLVVLAASSRSAVRGFPETTSLTWTSVWSQGPWYEKQKTALPTFMYFRFRRKTGYDSWCSCRSSHLGNYKGLRSSGQCKDQVYFITSQYHAPTFVNLHFEENYTYRKVWKSKWTYRVIT